MTNNIKFSRQLALKNPLIKARYSLDALEQKFLLFVIAIGMQNPDILRDYIEVPASVFQDKMGIVDNGMYKRIKKMSDSLTKKNISLENLEKTEFVFYSVFATIRYIDGSGSVKALINPGLIPYITDFKDNYTKMDLEYLMKLRSSYSIRFYELIKFELRSRKQVTFKIALEEIRQLFGLNEDDYLNFADFDKRIMRPSIKEANEKTDIFWKYTPIKTGRKVTHLEIFAMVKESEKIRTKTNENIEIIPLEPTANQTEKMVYQPSENNQNQSSNDKYDAFRHLPYCVGTPESPLESGETEELRNTKKRLQSLGFSTPKADKLIQEYDLEYLNFTLDKSGIETKEKVKNRAGYFQTILSDFKEMFESIQEEKRRQEELEKERQKELERQREERIEREKRRSAGNQVKEEENEIIDTWSQQNPEVYRLITEKYLEDLGSFFYNMYTEKARNNKKELIEVFSYKHALGEKLRRQLLEFIQENI